MIRLAPHPLSLSLSKAMRNASPLPMLRQAQHERVSVREAGNV